MHHGVASCGEEGQAPARGEPDATPSSSNQGPSQTIARPALTIAPNAPIAHSKVVLRSGKGSNSPEELHVSKKACNRPVPAGPLFAPGGHALSYCTYLRSVTQQLLHPNGRIEVLETHCVPSSSKRLFAQTRGGQSPSATLFMFPVLLDMLTEFHFIIRDTENSHIRDMLKVSESDLNRLLTGVVNLVEQIGHVVQKHSELLGNMTPPAGSSSHGSSEPRFKSKSEVCKMRTQLIPITHSSLSSLSPIPHLSFSPVPYSSLLPIPFAHSSCSSLVRSRWVESCIRWPSSHMPSAILFLLKMLSRMANPGRSQTTRPLHLTITM